MFMLSDLSKSGLAYEDINAEVCTNGYLIPYHTVKGEVIVNSLGQALMYRVRHASGEQRYTQPSTNEVGDLAQHPYFPPATFNVAGGDTLLICEGEKKTACAVKYLGMRAIGIGGCHSWGVKGEIHPLILAYARAHDIKRVILVPDGDVRRYDIASAYGTFRQKLQIEGFDASIVDMPKGLKLDDQLWREEKPHEWFDSLGTFTDLVEDPTKLAADYGLSIKPKGKGFEVVPNESNLHALITRHPAFPQFWFDMDRKQIMQVDELLKEGLHDFDILTTMQHRFQLHGAKMGAVVSAVARAAFENEKSPFLDTIRKVQWDGVERLERWLVDYCGADDNEYTRQLGKRWLVAAVARMSEPGCIVDYMLITKGRQGIGKSSLPTILFGPDNVVAIEGQEGQHKDLLAKMHMGLCANMEELSIMNTKEISALKPTITNRIDAFRRPFRRDTVMEPRRFVIYGSTDKAFPLPDDPAGHRRFPIVEIHKVEFAALEADREQLWAEACIAYDRGDAYSNVDDVSAQVQRFVRRDPMLEAFDEWFEEVLDNKDHGYRCTFRGHESVAVAQKEICSALGLPEMSGRSWAVSTIKEHMVANGWENVGDGPVRKNGTKLRRCWIRRV